jgi:hypothetical protein
MLIKKQTQAEILYFHATFYFILFYFFKSAHIQILNYSMSSVGVKILFYDFLFLFILVNNNNNNKTTTKNKPSNLIIYFISHSEELILVFEFVKIHAVYSF